MIRFKHCSSNWFKFVWVLIFTCFYVITKGGTSYAQSCQTKPLEFGYLVPGQTKTVDKYSSEALCLIRERVATGTYQVSIALPSSLSNGANTLPLIFASDDAAYWYFRANWIGPIEHDPATTFTTQNSTRDIVVRLGATVNVPLEAPSGFYSNSIIITLNRIGF